MRSTLTTSTPWFWNKTKCVARCGRARRDAAAVPFAAPSHWWSCANSASGAHSGSCTETQPCRRCDSAAFRVSSVLQPDTAAGVLEAVAWAAAEERPLEILGHGSKRGVGRPVQAEWTLDLSRLTGVTLYEPEELVLS